MKTKKPISTVLKELLNNNNFLKILSVFLALFVWIYIIYNVNPINEKVFDRMEVNLAFEGSIPDRNNLIYLMTDPNLTVSVTVSGSRTELINLSKEDIKVSLNLDSVLAAGTYNVNVTASTGNKDLTVTEIYPKSFTIEFAEESSRLIPVEVVTTGTFPDGYQIDEQKLSPKEITVTGPAQTVNSIEKASISVPTTNVKDSISGLFDIVLTNSVGENVDRRYLTISDPSVQADLKVAYHKTLPTSVELINDSGSNNKESLISVTLDTKTLEAIGPEKTLAGLESFKVGPLDTSQITKSGQITLPVIAMDGVTFNATEVQATVAIEKDVATKILTYKTAEMTCILPDADGKVARIPAGTVKITVRGKADTLKNLTTATLKCHVDVSEPKEDGTYPVYLVAVATNTTAFEVVGSYSVKVNIE